jgi:hypothetical protein
VSDPRRLTTDLDPEDGEDWESRWRAMPHRRLTSPPKISLDVESLAPLGETVSITISENPREFLGRVWRRSSRCPICGAFTVEGERLPASLHPRWASGLSVGVGVWVHEACFGGCPDADGPAPIPW